MDESRKFELNNKFALSHDSITHDVYYDGVGPAVVLMHKLPGMTVSCLRATSRIMECGFKVYVPLFFGHPKQYAKVKGFFALCIRHEFNIFTANGHSPIAGWLRELCRRADGEFSNRGVGLIGMCLTGNIVLSVMLEPAVRVPSMCEPAMPFFQKSALGVPEGDVEQGIPMAERSPILAFRFTKDDLCPKERFDTLRRTFGSNLCAIEIPSATEIPFRIPANAHSVLAGDYEDQDDPNHPVQHAFDEILLRFKRALVPRRSSAVL